jgi:hypothetical protein
MGMEGFDNSKMRMSPQEKAALSDVEREAQNSREATIDAANKKQSENRQGSPYAGTVEEGQKATAGEIIKEAQAENLQRAQETENKVARGMDVNNMSAKDKEAIAAAQRKVQEAFELAEKGKN